MVDFTDTTACRCRGGAGKWHQVAYDSPALGWPLRAAGLLQSGCFSPGTAVGLAHLPATPLRGGTRVVHHSTPSRHLLNQLLANFTLASGSWARGTMTRHQTPGRRSKLTSDWGDWAKVQMSLTEGENAVVCSYNQGISWWRRHLNCVWKEALALPTCRGTKMGLVGEDSGPRKDERTELLDHVEHQE